MMRRSLPSILLVFLAVTPAAAQIGVSPPVVEIDLNEPARTRTVRLFNYGNSPVEVQVRVHNWELDEVNRVRILPPTEQSLDQWLVINPLHFTIQPGCPPPEAFPARGTAAPNSPSGYWGYSLRGPWVSRC